jgi:hypothetical protein
MSAASLARLQRVRGLPTSVQALAAHLVAGALILGISYVAARLGHALALPGACLMEGLLAALVSRRMGLPVWWQGINLAFLPLLWLVAQAGIAPGWYLLGFLLLVLTSLGAVISRVPLYLSSRQAMLALAERLPPRAGLRCIDLGCGLGGPLAHLSRARPDLELHGVDAAPLPWLVSRLRLLGRARIRIGSLWEQDLSGFDVVYAYLSPAPMPRLWRKARQEMRPGSLFVSNSFTVPGEAPDEIVDLHDLNHSRLLIWRM